MAKLTKNTITVGQKCILTIKSNLYNYYKQNGQSYQRQYNVFSYQTKTSLKRIKDILYIYDLKMQPLKTLEKGVMVKILEYEKSHKWLKEEFYVNVKLEVVSGTEKGTIFFTELRKIQGRLNDDIRSVKLKRILNN